MRPKREPATHNQQTYMVTSETAERRPFFRHERWARLFLRVLYHYRGSAYQLHEFVVMPDHFHVLLTPTGSLERAVQFIKGGFSYRAKKELEYPYEIWQRGFSDHRIRDMADYLKHVEYIRLNPVGKGICRCAEAFPYSSAHPGLELDGTPQRLKPQAFSASDGAAKAAPLQSVTIGGDEDDAQAH